MARPLGARVALFTAGGVLGAGGTMIVGILLARYLTKEDMGTYQQLWLVYRLIIGLGLSGLARSPLYFVPSLKREHQRSLVVAVSLLVTIGGTAAAAFVGVKAPWIAMRFNNPALGPLLRLFAAYIFFTASVLHFPVYLVARGRHEFATLHQALVVAAVVSAAIYGTVTQNGLEAITLALVVTGVPLWIWGVGWLGREFFRLTGGQLVPIGRLLRYSIHLSLASATQALLLHIGPLSISVLALPERLAVFRMGATQVPFVAALTRSVTTAVTPTLADLFARKQLTEMVALWHRAIRHLPGLILPIFVFCFLMTSDIIVVLFSTKYLESTTIFRICLCVLPLRCGFYEGMLQALGRSREILISSIASALVATTLSFTLFPFVGLIGPAVGYVLGLYTLGLVCLFFICRFTGYSWATVLPWRDLGRQFVVALSAGVVLVPVLWYGYGDYALRLSLSRVALGSLLYFPVYLVLLKRAGYPSIGDLWTQMFARRSR